MSRLKDHQTSPRTDGESTDKVAETRQLAEVRSRLRPTVRSADGERVDHCDTVLRVDRDAPAFGGVLLLLERLLR